MNKLKRSQKDKTIRALTTALVRHCLLQYGGDKPINYATDMLRELSRALRRHAAEHELTIDEMGAVAADALELPKPKKKKRKS